ncbi:MAG: cytochrome c, partial [Deltaproteobacteria bacterium]|nr:cytochrome c [Deltaproteobacteria bacterium]
MKKMIWLVATLLVVASSGTAIAADGASIYASKCKMCYSDDGKGIAMMGPQLAG